MKHDSNINKICTRAKEWINDNKNTKEQNIHIENKSTTSSNFWPNNYYDDDRKRPIFEIDSHQLNTDGSKSKRYNNFTPCKMFVHANVLADELCSIMIGTSPHAPNQIKTKRTQICKSTPYKTDYYLTHEGKTIDGNTPNTIHSIIHTELVERNKKKEKQGYASRLLNISTLNPHQISFFFFFHK